MSRMARITSRVCFSTIPIWIALASMSCSVRYAAADEKEAGAKLQAGASAKQPVPNSADEREIRRLIANYTKSVDAADTTLASRIWSHAPEASSIYPLGEEHGFEQIKQHLYVHLMGEMFSERDLQVHDISVHVYGVAAWAEFSWDFHAKFKKDGSPIANHGRETQIYHKEEGGWRLVHVHYSGAPLAGVALGS